jgi:hypothetical protein
LALLLQKKRKEKKKGKKKERKKVIILIAAYKTCLKYVFSSFVIAGVFLFLSA